MAAHLRPIRKPKCYRCGKSATVTLHTTRNEPVADYCTPHGRAALRDYQARDEATT